MAQHHQKHRVRLNIIILILIFIVPVLLAWLLYTNKANLLFRQMTNYGQLVTPPFAIAEIPMLNVDGQLLDNQIPDVTSTASADNNTSPVNSVAISKTIKDKSDTTNGKWLLLYFSPGQCDNFCQHSLQQLRQIQIATGGNRDRIECALLSYQEPMIKGNMNEDGKQDEQEEQFDQWLEANPPIRRLWVDQTQFDQIIQNRVKQTYALEPGTLFMVDPLGNVIMTYPAGVKGDAILHDLEHLLKVSQIG